MKLGILSDLHLSQGDLPLPGAGADMVILAGDIARPARAIAWASRIPRPVLYVPGNHEFYGSSIEGALAELKRLAAGTNVRVLDCEETLVDGVRFLGATLWTDFRIAGEERGSGSMAIRTTASTTRSTARGCCAIRAATPGTA